MFGPMLRSYTPVYGSVLALENFSDILLDALSAQYSMFDLDLKTPGPGRIWHFVDDHPLDELDTELLVTLYCVYASLQSN
jgi:hypothetical protein